MTYFRMEIVDMYWVMSENHSLLHICATCKIIAVLYNVYMQNIKKYEAFNLPYLCLFIFMIKNH